jgi:hypothetical protein
MRKISGLLGAVVLALGVASCGGGGAAGPGGGGGGGGGGGDCPATTFCMGPLSFFTAGGTSVTTLSVAANTPVTWTNESGTTHNVTFDDQTTALAVGGGSSGNIGNHSSGSNQRQFAVSGSSHPFHCTLHGAIMHGTVTVL